METSLKKIKQKLIEIKPLLELNYSRQLLSNGVPYYDLNELQLLRQGINSIEKLGLFSNLVQDLYNSALFNNSNLKLRVNSEEFASIESNISILISLIENFISVLEKTTPTESTDSINIKLPPVEDFDDLSKVSREIHLALTQVILQDEIGGHTKIVSVENGSIWINVFVGSTAVSVIASIVWSAAVIHKKILEGRILEEQLRGLKVKNDSLEDILSAQKAETQILLTAEANFVSSENFSKNEPENIEKLKNFISIFADLISKGAEIKPALMAPEEGSNLFPDTTKIISLESRMKKLSN
ncbi:MAG: hypothetical protein RSC72_15415 [Algoriella sp.]|uniref:hypothetical protein n=1 Tax=Algoriella sp. TaxID=1872434 RepID=UPI002FC666EF